ncbi:MAG TPA: 5-(carboxyamino)imidazole ribonucleotide synthase, partial [Armatimonadota bacterium]|nr:5-(carboxyamino)imidazole ribonucleotide synthase [Armatimonadota bacterium]
DLLRPAAMANLLGEDIGTGERLPELIETLADRSLALHLYGKREARRGRKMGHLTVLAADADEAFARVTRAKQILSRRAPHV